MVAIARALQDQEGEHTGVLVLDEPTASLPRAEVVRLMGALHRFADERPDDPVREPPPRRGHRRVRPGHGPARRSRWPARSRSDEITEERADRAHRRPHRSSRPTRRCPTSRATSIALETKGLTGGPLRGVDLQLRQGEVLGIAGLLGSGRSELLKMIFGAYPIRGGHDRARRAAGATSATSARPWTPASPTCPRTAAPRPSFLDLTLSENVSAALVRPYWKNLRLRNRAADADARGAIKEFFIRAVVGAPGDGHALGWQPAEGHPGPVAAPRARRSCCSTSRPRASTSAPGPRSTSWSAQRRAAQGCSVAARHQRLRGAVPRRRPRDRPRPRTRHGYVTVTQHRTDPAHRAGVQHAGDRLMTRDPRRRPTPTPDRRRRLDATAGAGPDRRRARRARPRRVLAFIEKYALVVLFGATSASSSASGRKTSSTFPTSANIQNVLGNQAVIGILAMAIIIPLVSGEFDFSVGSLAGLTQVLCAGFMAQTGHARVAGHPGAHPHRRLHRPRATATPWPGSA